MHYWSPLSEQKRGGGRGGGVSQTELHLATVTQKWKTAGTAPGRILPRPRRRGAALRPRQDIGLGHPTFCDRYLVEMRIPGDIVPSLLQGHRAHRAGLGAAASGGCGGRPARDGTAGSVGQESQPRASAQRGAHAPCADLAPGRNQGQGRLPTRQALACCRALSLSPGHVHRERAGGPEGLKAPAPPLFSGHLRGSGACGAQALPSAGQSESKPRKQILCG